MIGLWSLMVPYLTRKYWWRLLHNTAHTIRMRQEQHEAAAAARLDHSIQPQPAVLMLMNPGRPLTKRTPQPSVCYFETEARFIEGQDMLDLKLGERWTEILF